MVTLSILIDLKQGRDGIRKTAKDIGISPTTLSRVKNGHIPDGPTLTKICDWLGCDWSIKLEPK